MKLGIIADHSERSFHEAKRRDLSFLELCINVTNEDGRPVYHNIRKLESNLPDLRRYMDETGVGIGSVGRWGPDRLDTNGKVIEDEFEQTCRLIDAAATLDCKTFVCGCNYVEGLSLYKNATGALEFLGRAVDYARSKDVRIATYNCRWNSFVCDPAAWRLIHGELPELGIKFDPSHSIYAGGDYLREIAEWAHRFYHFHIKGSLLVNGKRHDDPPAGLDQTDWNSVFALLYAHRYDGTLSIEPHSDKWQGDLGERGIDYTVRFIRNYLI